MGRPRHCKKNCKKNTSISSSSSSASSSESCSDFATSTKRHIDGTSSHCEINCCNAIAKATGDYYLRVSQIPNALVFNGQYCKMELSPKISNYAQYTAELVALITEAMQHLFNCCTECCEGAAHAIADIGVGSNIQLKEMLLINADIDTTASFEAIKSGMINIVNLILTNAGCAPLVVV